MKLIFLAAIALAAPQIKMTNDASINSQIQVVNSLTNQIKTSSVGQNYQKVIKQQSDLIAQDLAKMANDPEIVDLDKKTKEVYQLAAKYKIDVKVGQKTGIAELDDKIDAVRKQTDALVASKPLFKQYRENREKAQKAITEAEQQIIKDPSFPKLAENTKKLAEDAKAKGITLQSDQVPTTTQASPGQSAQGTAAAPTSTSTLKASGSSALSSPLVGLLISLAAAALL